MIPNQQMAQQFASPWIQNTEVERTREQDRMRKKLKTLIEEKEIRGVRERER